MFMNILTKTKSENQYRIVTPINNFKILILINWTIINFIPCECVKDH
jgi:hypothetical protein